MELRIEQKIVLVYFALGAAVALVSDVFSSISPLSNPFAALLFPLVVYVVALYILIKNVKHKKMKSLVTNSLLSYFLIWLVIWVLLYNL